MRAKLMTMPPSAGSAPPLRPVPDPRATKGMLCCAQMRTMAWTCGGGAREDDGSGDGAEVGEAVALVGLELAGLGNQRAGLGGVVCGPEVQGITQSLKDGGVEHKR